MQDEKELKGRSAVNTIEIKNLTFTYPGAKAPTLKQVDVSIEKGDFLAVIGNNGCGKSTLCRTLNGLIPHFITGDIEGDVFIDGKNTKEEEIGTLAKKVGYVYQDFENQIVCPTVLEDASYACLNYAMDNYIEKGKEALRVCGLGNKMNDYVWQLSGGQKHLLALAGTAALSPDILILDEPIAQLDPAHADGIYEVLKELNEKYQKTVIVIEHHTEYITRYCKHALLIKDGSVKWKLPAKEAMRRVKELQESNIFPPQVTIAAQRMEDAGLLPKGTMLPVNIEEGEKIFSPFLKNNRTEYGAKPVMKEHDKLVELLSGVKFTNYKERSAQIVAFLEKYIPDVAAMETQMKKYEKFFKTADGKQKALEKKNDELTEALEKSEQQSTLKKLQEARLQSDYERAKAILDRIPPEIIREYTHRSIQKHDINR